VTRQLLVVIIAVTIANAFVMTSKTGCGVLLIPGLFGWQVVTVAKGSFFADNNAAIVMGVGALISGCFLALVLGLAALIAKRRGLLTSKAALTKMFVIATLVYLLIGILWVPFGPCI
jgi:hypothetical protein